MQENLYSKSRIFIPSAIIWIQCIAFVVLYGFWILPEVVGFRNTAFVIGAIAGIFPIYQYRWQLLKRRALPIWLICALITWATFHLCFLARDYDAQLLEFGRIWKYCVLGAMFAIGLGASLANSAEKKDQFWRLIYLGLCIPVLTYLLKYGLTNYGAALGINPPAYLKIYFSSQPYYIQKTDYIAFCLPVLAVSLGQIRDILTMHIRLLRHHYLAIAIYMLMILSTLFLFYIQDTKNGIAYSAMCFILFTALLIFDRSSEKWLRKSLVIAISGALLLAILYPHIEKNPTWANLIADTNVGFDLEKYPQWKYAGEQGYPNNQYGRMVSITTYERAAWFKAGVQLAQDNPLGYGLMEDSFRKLANAKWIDSSARLSHSHSGWLDIVLALGLPGLLCTLGALLSSMWFSKEVAKPWKDLIFWPSIANLILAMTTEIATTTTFTLLIFWISWAGGLILGSKTNTSSQTL